MRTPDHHEGAAAFGGWQNDAFWTRRLDDGLVVEATTRADSPVLERFFAGYDRAFVLPDEREELLGFRDCLALNSSWRGAFGRTQCELVTTFSDANGSLLAGANFLATALAPGPASPPAAVALNYVFVEAAARGRGLLRKVIAVVRTLALESVALPALPDSPPPAMFIEQNDPLRLSKEDYRRDTEHSGMDQIDRLAIWAKVGARIVDFPYVQPALSAEQSPDHGLVYAAVDYFGDAVPAAVLRQHLESFFGISVLKGRAPSSDVTAAAQLADLSARTEPVALLRIEPALARLRNGFIAKRHNSSLRSLAREVQR
jgi:hypothetical protein